MPKYPFEASLDEILQDTEPYVDSVFSCLESEFTVMPKGAGFIEYPVFEQGYEALKAATKGFSEMKPTAVLPVALSQPIAIVVLRTILGFTPPEWAYVTTLRTGVSVTQGFVRSLDRKVRMSPQRPLKSNDSIEALVETACHLLSEGAPKVEEDQLHRLDKADTKHGLESTRSSAGIGVPYAMLLYERFLGRPFAGHRDSVSELIGSRLEAPIEDLLTAAGISYRKTTRAEKIQGFDQTPDFIVPSEFNPQIIIEAKMTEDDGTARDKATRIQHLGELSLAGRQADDPKFEVVACIGGRGFGVRRNDMRKILIATRGKVFTLKTLDQLIGNTRLKEYCTRQAEENHGNPAGQIWQPCYDAVLELSWGRYPGSTDGFDQQTGRLRVGMGPALGHPRLVGLCRAMGRPEWFPWQGRPSSGCCLGPTARVLSSD